MAQIIASTYEVIKQIGSGGGGIVYLGKHLRLDKLVAIKADRRSVLTNLESLRREVDALKNLSHSYIPQVYDFIIEDNTVYTVMDFIEGESLDKPLKRGERFSQALVIRWAHQLLEALVYLHSRPPYGILHSDIKPANIMLTPQNDICLIDFNIALALGAEGAIRVGLSRGYASPEHYGLAGSAALDSQGSKKIEETEAITVDGANVAVSASNRKKTSTKGHVLLDVRSDIYSLGATLYHLLSGRRPNQDASTVATLSSSDGVSEAVADIIRKAMAPDPNDRYQTAQEMLDAFEHLHDTDPRTKYHRMKLRICIVALSLTLLTGGISTFSGLRLMQQAEEQARIAAEAAEAEERAAKEAEEEARVALSSVREAEGAWNNGDVPFAIEASLKAASLESPYKSQAQRILTDALGVYDLSEGFKSHLVLDLQEEPTKVSLSPSGTRVAAMTGGKTLIFDTESGDQLISLASDPSALSDVVFIDEDVILYAGDTALMAYSLTEKRELWEGSPATNITLSGNKKIAAAVFKDDPTATIYDVVTGEVLHTVVLPGKVQDVVANDIAIDPENELFCLNEDGTRLAISFADGGMRIFNLQNNEDYLIIYHESEFTRFEGGFFGNYLAYTAKGDQQYVFAVIDVPGARQTGGFQDPSPLHVQADSTGIYICRERVLVKIDPESGEQQTVAYTDHDILKFLKTGDYTVTATEDDSFTFFGPMAAKLENYEAGTRPGFLCLNGPYAVVGSSDATSLRVLKLETYQDLKVLEYDRTYDHNEARVSADGKTFMLFRFDRFRLYGADGELLKDVEIPDAEGGQVYDQQYRREGGESWLEVTYYNGLIRNYSAADGALISETQGEVPDESLYEEYLTDSLRIEAPFRGTPAVYDRETGELVAELESDAYLTYVTQVGDYIMTEYMTTDEQRYGLLLNEECETLAYLPNLCDVLEDGTLLFDDMQGILRQSRIYSMQELTALAKN